MPQGACSPARKGWQRTGSRCHRGGSYCGSLGLPSTVKIRGHKKLPVCSGLANQFSHSEASDIQACIQGFAGGPLGQASSALHKALGFCPSRHPLLKMSPGLTLSCGSSWR